MSDTGYRTCRKCGETKPESGFYSDRHYSGKDDASSVATLRSHVCKSCSAEKDKTYYQENKAVINKYRRENRSKITERDNRYRENNKEKIRETNKRSLERRSREIPYYRKNERLKWLFGISIHEYFKMDNRQGGVCLICSRPEKSIDKRTGKVKLLSVDHCHETGQIRGLLCWHCNAAIGKFNDDPALLRKAAEYLDKYK